MGRRLKKTPIPVRDNIFPLSRTESEQKAKDAMIKALLFDFGQTLVDSAEGFRQAEKNFQKKIFATLFPDPDDDTWAVFITRYRQMRTEFHQRSEFSRASLWQAVCRYFKHPPDPEELEKWETDYWEQVKARTRPFPETLAVLKKLSARYRLGLVTNTQGQKKQGRHRLALFPELEKFFAAIVVAGEAGIPPKPDPEPFERCLRSLGARPDEAAYIGDDWRIDIRGAAGAGLRPIWLKHHTVQRRWPETDGSVTVITSLEPLPDLFG